MAISLPKQAIDMTGRRFGRLVVQELEGRRPRANGKSVLIWRCSCDCGQEAVVAGTLLRRGETKSCGCAFLEASRTGTHGYARTKKASDEYQVWCAIKARCTNEKSIGYKNYGARGITIAPEWLSDFPAFFEHVGQRPSPQHSIDRIDNSIGYHPGNVRWATRGEQSRNTRRNVWLVVDGERRTIKDWGGQYGISAQSIAARIRLGWSHEDAVKTPLVQSQTITLAGETKTISEWSETTGIKTATIHHRLKRGYAPEAILSAKRPYKRVASRF